MKKTLAEIAKLVGGRVVGDGNVLIKGIAGIKEAHQGDLTFLANPKYLPMARETEASAIIVGKDLTVEGKSVLQTENPSLAFSKVVAFIKDDLSPKIKGIHSTAVIDKDSRIEASAGIGPHAVVDKGASIGKNTIICAGVFIGAKSEIGDNCLIYPNVTVRENVTIGNNVIIHSGSVIGSDGFGYIAAGDKHVKIPQMGTVVIEDDVEIGACVTIDRARFDKTLIGRGTKIDNLVQIAHNVQTGENCIIVALAGIAGSTKLGKNVTVAGQVGIAGHLTVGDGAVIAAQAGVAKNVHAGTMVSGYPAEEHKKAARILGHVGRLPHYVEEIRTLKQRIEELEIKLLKQSQQ